MKRSLGIIVQFLHFQIASYATRQTPSTTPQLRNSPPATVWPLQRSPQCGSVRCCRRRRSHSPANSRSHLHPPCNPQWGQQRPHLWSSPWPRPGEIKGRTATTTTAVAIRTLELRDTKGMFKGEQHGCPFSSGGILKHPAIKKCSNPQEFTLEFWTIQIQCKSSSSSEIAHRDFPSTKPTPFCRYDFCSFAPSILLHTMVEWNQRATPKKWCHWLPRWYPNSQQEFTWPWHHVAA